MAHVDDHQLWRRARDGDADAFGILFDRYAPEIYAYCFRRIGDWALAEDLTSVTFLEAWRRRDVELQPYKVAPWLYGIATNVVRSQRRSLRRHAGALRRIPPLEEQADFANDATDRLHAEECMRDILVAISQLPATEQEVIALSIWQGLSHDDTAFALGVSVVTVRTRLFRARRRMRDRLDEANIGDLTLTTEMENRSASADL
jgi:RNA polymerase sigma-70 factor (ECF subfamily)